MISEQEANPTDPLPTPSVPSILHGGEFDGTTVVGRKRDRRPGSENKQGREADVEPCQRNSRRGDYRLRNSLPHSEVDGVVEDGSRQQRGSWSGRSPSHVDLEAQTVTVIRRVVSITGMRWLFSFSIGRFKWHPTSGVHGLSKYSGQHEMQASAARGGSSTEQARRLLPVIFSLRFPPRLPVVLRSYAEYKLTQLVDSLRKREHKRLKRLDEVCVDYMGASLYPESLVCSDSTFLRRAVLGNAYSSGTR